MGYGCQHILTPYAASGEAVTWSFSCTEVGLFHLAIWMMLSLSLRVNYYKCGKPIVFLKKLPTNFCVFHVYVGLQGVPLWGM